MFVRFCCALVGVVAISLTATALEKRNLELRRSVSRQTYRLEVLLEKHATQRALVQKFGAPGRLVDQLEPHLPTGAKPAGKSKRSPAKNTAPQLIPAPAPTTAGDSSPIPAPVANLPLPGPG